MVAGLFLAAALAVGAGAPALAHPLHTTMAEVTIDRPHGSVRLVVRVFADDFGTAVNAARKTGSWDVRAAAYVANAISIVDEMGRPLLLRDCGTRRQGDVLWLCAEAAAKAQRLALRDQMLCELFADQVNVVRITDGTATQSMLFTRGDPGRPIGR
jgi:hypothetical protein